MLRLFLFDVDMTLVDTGGAGRRALDRAFHDRLGVARAFDGYHFFGRVDQAILEEMYAHHTGRSIDAATYDGLVADYLARLADEVAATPDYRVLPGARELLETLAALPDCRLGLATGNFEEGARIKLRRGGLDPFFAAGGFGCDTNDRAELTRIGFRRLLADGAPRPPRDRVFVVGDTPNDILAAHANGAQAVAVATGGYDRAALARYRPRLLLDDLTDCHAWLRELGVPV